MKEHVLNSHGYRVIEKLRDNERFLTEHGQLDDGREVFVKAAKTEKTRGLLENQFKSTAPVNEIGSRSKTRFRAPEALNFDGQTLVTEWIYTDPLESALVKPDGFRTELLCDFLEAYDSFPVPKGQVVEFKSAEDLQDKITPFIESKIINPKLASAALRRFKQVRAKARPAWQDGDIKLSHIYPDPINLGNYVVVDTEHARASWPRFYDLGNNLARYWVRGEKPKGVELVRKYLEVSGESEETLFEPLVLTLLSRGITMHPEGSGQIEPAQEILAIASQAQSLADLLD